MITQGQTPAPADAAGWLPPGGGASKWRLRRQSRPDPQESAPDFFESQTLVDDPRDDEPRDDEPCQSPHPGAAALRMTQSGKVGFRLFDPERVVHNYLEEPGEIKVSRSRIHEKLLSILVKPLGQFALGSFSVLLGVLLTTRIKPQPAVPPKPIEYVPAGLADEVDTARGALERYFAAGSIGEKAKHILPGVTLEQMKAYFAGGGSDLVLGRENILYSEKNSDRARHWYSFTLTPPGTLQEIRTFVKMEGDQPRLHWSSYIQEKDRFAARIAVSTRPGVHDLRVGVCRAARLEGKPRVALIGMDGGTLGYVELNVPNAADILNMLDYKKPVCATVQLTTQSDGAKQVTRWKSWGLDLPRADAGGTPNYGPRHFAHEQLTQIHQ